MISSLRSRVNLYPVIEAKTSNVAADSDCARQQNRDIFEATYFEARAMSCCDLCVHLFDSSIWLFGNLLSGHSLCIHPTQNQTHRLGASFT